jgi:hypothetical protein
LQENDARRAQLVAAAEALVTWIHARRDTWPEMPDGVVSRPAPSVEVPTLAPIAEAIRPIGPAPEVPFVFTNEPVIEAVPEPEPVRRRWSEILSGVLRAILGLGAIVARVFASLLALLRLAITPLTRVSRRAAGYAAVLGIVLLGGWLARPFWPMVMARIGSLTAQSPPPIEKPAPVAAPGSGQLMVRSDPTGARVSVDGKPLGVTPLDIDGLSSGRHTVVIETDQGSVRRTVAIVAGKPTLVSESIYAGFLKVFAPFELQITDGSRAIRLDDQSQVMLPPGSYQLQMENAALGFRETRRVDVNPGQTSTLSIVPPPSSLSVTSNAPAVVLIDGQQVGATPLANHPIALGTRDIVVRSQSGQERRFTRQVTVAPVQVAAEF